MMFSRPFPFFSISPLFHRPSCAVVVNSMNAIRHYKAHLPGALSKSCGRSVVCRTVNNPSTAYNELRSILKDANVRQTVRYQERFERPTDMRRRKKKESKFRIYMAHMKKQIRMAYGLKRR